MTLTKTHTGEESQTTQQNRAYCRVSVTLKAMIKKEDGHFIPTQTLNISEGGVLLKHPAGVELSTDGSIQVHISGIISDLNPQQIGNKSIYTMKLIRQTAEYLGLQFL